MVITGGDDVEGVVFRVQHAFPNKEIFVFLDENHL
jgi:hypothetical protein